MQRVVTIPNRWRVASLALVLVVFACIVLFRDTWMSIVSIWERSETFAHGYLVAPTSAWLVWRCRSDFLNLSPSFGGFAVLCLMGLGLLWLSADLVSVLVIRQWAVVGILICGVWAVLGNHVTSRILFPLLFLFLMVPFGEEFIPYLMDYTAWFVVTMLRLTGISVYQQGTFISLASGEWSVVEGCSGLRYLIASFTLGTVYAYLNYTSYSKRALFMLVAFLLPIFANGLRAYMIVMIGHLSNMKLATGVDHIIYGWVFFGLVMLLLFYIGSFWQDADDVSDGATATGDGFEAQGIQSGLQWSAVPFVLLATAVWPLSSTQLRALQAVHAEIPASLHLDAGATAAPEWGWMPTFKGVMADAHFVIGDKGEGVALYIANFGDESQGGELINSQNYLVPQKHEVWRVIQSTPVTLEGKAWSHPVEEAILHSDSHDILVWRWYALGDVNTVNRYYIKVLQLFKRLTGDSSPELMFVLYTKMAHGEKSAASDRLKHVMDDCCKT